MKLKAIDIEMALAMGVVAAAFSSVAYDFLLRKKVNSRTDSEKIAAITATFLTATLVQLLSKTFVK